MSVIFRDESSSDSDETQDSTTLSQSTTRQFVPLTSQEIGQSLSWEALITPPRASKPAEPFVQPDRTYEYNVALVQHLQSVDDPRLQDPNLRIKMHQGDDQWLVSGGTTVWVDPETYVALEERADKVASLQRSLRRRDRRRAPLDSSTSAPKLSDSRDVLSEALMHEQSIRAATERVMQEEAVLMNTVDPSKQPLIRRVSSMLHAQDFSRWDALLTADYLQSLYEAYKDEFDNKRFDPILHNLNKSNTSEQQARKYLAELIPVHCNKIESFIVILNTLGTAMLQDAPTQYRELAMAQNTLRRILTLCPELTVRVPKLKETEAKCGIYSDQ